MIIFLPILHLCCSIFLSKMHSSQNARPQFIVSTDLQLISPDSSKSIERLCFSTDTSDGHITNLNDDIIRDVFTVTPDHPRYTEGSVLELGNGVMLYSVSEFNSGPGDHATAQIIGVKSSDGGRTWGPRFTLQENIGKLNVMSSTLRRLDDFSGKISFGHFFMIKNALDDLQGYLRISHDEGKSFGDTIRFTESPGYHVMNNDRILRLSSGRLIAPLASTPDVEKDNHFKIHCTYSDDQGMTWQASRNQVDYAARGAMEPDVIEFNDGRLGMIFRTQLGHIGISYSYDQGMTWSEGMSWNVRAPESPATCRRIPSTGDLLLIWNDNYEPGAGHQGKRIPLTAAISSDEGQTWKHKRNLETGPGITAAYCSLTFVRDRAILTYTLRNDETLLRSHRFRSLPVSWFYENP